MKIKAIFLSSELFNTRSSPQRFSTVYCVYNNVTQFYFYFLNIGRLLNLCLFADSKYNLRKNFEH